MQNCRHEFLCELQMSPSNDNISTSKALSLPYHSLVRHDLFDVSIEERDDDSLAVNADVFSCAVCESNYARAITVYFLNLKQNHSPDIVFLEFL